MRIRHWITGLVAGLLVSAAQAQAPAAGGAGSEAPVASAQPTPAAVDPADLGAWLDGFMPLALARSQIAGAVVVVVRGSDILLARGYGLADVERRKPVDPDATLFRPGSVSKLLVWTAVMQQVEAGRLDLDRDVNDYLEFTIPPFEGQPITLRQIMTHTAGFEESVRHLISSDPEAMMPLGDLMKRALPKRVYAPGTMPAYSNYATALAGYIVQRVSGMPLEAYMERHVFAPAGMTRSTFRQPLPDQLKPLMSQGYRLSTGGPRPFEFVLPWPAGSLSATGTDMGRFMIAHLNGGGALLRPETARQMHDFRAPGIGPLNRMALGFYEQQVNGHRAIAHGGDTQQFHSNLWLFPDAGLGLYVSFNSDGTPGSTLALRSALFHGFADRYLPAVAAAPKAADAAAARREASLLAGTYQSSRGSFTNFMSLFGLLGQLKVAVDGEGHLRVPGLDPLSATPRDWVPIGPWLWQDRITGERLAAEVADGRVVRLGIEPLSPFMVYLPVSPGRNSAWLLPALVAAIGVALLTVLAWPVGTLIRRRYGVNLPLAGSQLHAWRWSRIFAAAAVVATAGWAGMAAAFTADVGSIGGRLDWLLQGLRLLTPIAALGLTLTAAWHLWLSLQAPQSWTMRLGALLLVLAGLVLAWVTYAFHLYGFSLVY
ncbi:MAG: serine hydrolase domain-containing protein [Sphingomonadaceae bacterium]